jgi:hypothetical protein
MAPTSDPCKAGRQVHDDGLCEGPADAVKVADTYGEVANGCIGHAAQLVRDLRSRPGRGTIRVTGVPVAVQEVNRRAAARP